MGEGQNKNEGTELEWNQPHTHSQLRPDVAFNEGKFCPYALFHNSLLYDILCTKESSFMQHVLADYD